MSKNLAKHIANICIEEVVHDENNRKKIPEAGVLRYHPPAELEKLLELELHISKDGCSEEEFVALCEKFISLSCKTWHPGFMPQLISGIDTYGLCASWLLEILNTSSFTYEVAPVITLVQRTIIAEVTKMYGLPSGDGVFCPGASLANMYAMMLARQKRFPNVRRSGLCGLPPMAIFTSDTSHYSIEKGAVFLGFGLDAVIKVETDDRGIMLPGKLRDAIKKVMGSGRVPLMVNATAGTTMLGSFDCIDSIVLVCEEFNFDESNRLWLHCDAAFGHSAIFSNETVHLLKGSGKLDSVTLDFHKIAGALLQCSLIITKHCGLLKESISTSAGYLFQADKGYDVSYDSGDKSIQCSQKSDALKWWLLWKAKGTAGMELEINELMRLSKFAQRKISEMNGDGFYLVIPEFQYVNVCFWYVPSWMRKSDDSTHSFLRHPLLSKVAPKVRARLRERGNLLINCASHKSVPNYFRIVCTNRLLTEEDVVDILHLIRDTTESFNESDF